MLEENKANLPSLALESDIDDEIERYANQEESYSYSHFDDGVPDEPEDEPELDIPDFLNLDDFSYKKNTIAKDNSPNRITTRDGIFSKKVSHGDNGVTYKMDDNLFGGGTTTRGSDGSVYKTHDNLFGGGKTTYGNNGVTYKTSDDLLGGGTTTRGSDGSVYKTHKGLFGDDITTKR